MTSQQRTLGALETSARWLDELGRMTQEERENRERLITEARDDGATMADIAQALGVARPSVYRIIEERT